MLNVANNSNSLLPWYYKVAATWGSHEGSILFWSVTLSWWALAVSFASRRLSEEMMARVLGIMGLVLMGFLAFMLFTSNPFQRLFPAAPEGADLNPLLQDPGMVFHPPLLYLLLSGSSPRNIFPHRFFGSGSFRQQVHAHGKGQGCNIPWNCWY